MNQRARFLPLAAAILFAGSALRPAAADVDRGESGAVLRSDRWPPQERAQAPRR